MAQRAQHGARPRYPVQAGHTLIELLVVTTLAAILAALGLPSMQGVAGRRGVDSAVEALASALRLARTEAMKRGEPVSLCALAASPAGPPWHCADISRDWSAGWLVFVDRGERGVLDDGDLLLHAQQAGAQPPHVQATLGHVTFQPTGISLTAASHFDFVPFGLPADRLDGPGSRRACLNKPGRMRTLPGGQECA